MKDDELQRMIEGRSTIRDRWRAFYRLYRMAKKAEHWPQATVSTTLKILMPSCGRLLSVLQESGPRLSSDQYPPFLRKMMLDSDKRRRLHGDRYQWLERDQAVARMLSQEGREMTPEEVAETRIKITKKIRAHAAANDLHLPADDVAMWKMLKECR